MGHYGTGRLCRVPAAIQERNERPAHTDTGGSEYLGAITALKEWRFCSALPQLQF